MTFIKTEEDAALKAANELLANENQKRGLKTAEQEYVESRIAGLIEQFRAEFRTNEAKREAEAKAAQEEERFRAEQESRRKFIEATRHAYVAPPAKVLCERTGDYVLETVASHICEAGRCVHNPRKALAAGQISKLQYEIMKQNGEAEIGCIIGVAFDAPIDPHAEKTENMSLPPVNPLTEVPQYRPIKHVGIVL